jgi:hypothetical protein
MALPTMTDAMIEQAFADGCVDIYRDWQVLGPADRRSRVQELIRAVVRAISLPDVGFSWVDGARISGQGGQLDAQNWVLKINKSVSERHNVTVADMQWFAGVLYHEMRHGEQWFRCAQGVVAQDLVLPTLQAWMAAGGKLTPTIASQHMHMPAAVLEAAEARGKPSYTQHSASLPIQGWFDSIWGANRAHRGTVLAHPNIMTVGSPAHLAYISLPEEVDAYATQHAVEALIGTALAGVVQRQVAQSDSVASLASGHLAAASTTGANEDAMSRALRAVKLRPTGANLGTNPRTQALRATHERAMTEASATQASGGADASAAPGRVRELVASINGLNARRG